MSDLETDDNMTREYSRKVGEQLRKVRHQQQYSLQAVESASCFEFKASVLGAYERGERAISVARLQRLASFYKVPVDQLLPRSGGASKVTTTDPREKVTLDLTRVDSAPAPYGDMIARYVEMIQVERQDFNRYVLTIRRDDVEALSRMVGTTAAELRDWLQDLGLRS